ncbi:asparagine synthase-related protein [Mariprofundus sp. KV]|uniref:asparagine synthase-related protein n=1 Tax=Mariprofundus sp. KV TaxID=2608715 RepID=UPI0015A04226|nr:asparagine synthase-related protein [Mariprofundus sp. KV]NWF35522.1 hypothetical protein [Mariprofundus sp. KV]
MSTIHASLNLIDQQPAGCERIEKMLEASAYWRPDATHQLSSCDHACRMARASLINTRQSRLESVHRDSSGNMITANARLDNRDELAGQLEIPANELEQHADGMLILLAYKRWGEACPKQLLGDFAFVIYDAVQDKVFAARDHFGVKVLFYTRTESEWLLSNEHNAFFTSGAVKKVIKESWLVQQLWALRSNRFESPVNGIETLPAAHSITLDRTGNASISRYWDLEERDDWNGWDDASLIDELKRRFEQAVRSRLNSEYPLASELSEGIDSNGITGFAARALGEEPLYTLSYGCIELDDDNRHIWEATYQDIYEMQAMHANIQPIWRKQEKNNSLTLQQQTLNRHAGVPMPVKDGAHISYGRLAAKKGVRTLLSGWGGDHCVSTYGDFYESELLNQGKFITLHRLLREKRARGRSGKPAKAWAGLLLKHAIPPLFRSLMRRKRGLVDGQHHLAHSHPLKRIHVERYQLMQKQQEFLKQYERYSVKAHHQRELFDVGVEPRLVESELCSRIYRIEYRYPMLDVRLVELAYNMPSHLKVYQGIERYMYRKILEGVTTERIRWRVKADVQHPRYDHIDNNNRSESRESIKDQTDDSALVRDYLDLDGSKQAKARRLQKGIELLLEIEEQRQSGEMEITKAS